MSKLRVLDLFSGIGGFSLGLERTGGFETAAFCEYEPFPRAVLAKHWPDVPCFPDVRKLKGSDIDGPVDVICGGYPCQPFSAAGRRRGKEDDRHLWPEFNRLVAELRPTWVIGENVAGHISMGLDDVLSDLEGQGYACRTFVIPACAVDAPHRRDRVWIVAHAKSKRPNRRSSKIRREAERQKADNSNILGKPSDAAAGDVAFSDRWDGKSSKSERPRIRATPDRQGANADACGTSLERKAVANANDTRLQRREKAGNSGSQREGRDKQPERCADLPRAAWLPEPDVGRVANGVPRRVDRLKALGNAVVPQIPEMIGRAILAAELGDNQ